MEKTLAIIKPDAVARGLVGRIISDIERACYNIVDMKMLRLTEKLAGDFYKEHKGKPFFENLVKFTASGPCIFLVLEKKNAIEDWRKFMGPTDIKKAMLNPHTIRGKFGRWGRPTYETVVHGSDSPESAVRELNLFYDELFYWRGGP